ncbi:MAG: M28 family peptidase [Acidobacteria bacterium]|nr:M28 family peptidase [Acidobacteriota bacterium]
MPGQASFLTSEASPPERSWRLDLAAEYIAAQFRRAGLEPAGDDGYFQTAKSSLSGRDMKSFELKLANGAGVLAVGAEQATFGFQISGVQLWALDAEPTLAGAGLVKAVFKDGASLDSFTREQLQGKVVMTEFPTFPRGDRARGFQLLGAENEFMAKAHALGVPLVIAFDRESARGRGAGSVRLVDPESKGRQSPLGDKPTAPLLFVHGTQGAQFFDALPAGMGPATVTFRAPSRIETPVSLRNVAGLLRGSDPLLRDTYVLVSAHYDHLGVRDNCAEGDCVFNGANDDGSGTVAVVEIASALSALNPRPKRSILFITFFGEELGLVGSRFYGRNPLVPLSKTVAQVNMEQVGRTDDSEGAQVGRAALTGFDYSTLGALFERAGEASGVVVYKHPTNSDAFFGRSDNQALADVGVPAHTFGVAFEFPDYHAVGDHWEKIDYANMERVIRTVALGTLMIAEDPQAPRWNEANPKTAKYVEAWKKLQGK